MQSIYENSESMISSYIHAKTTQFVDHVLQTRRITSREYETFLQEILNTNQHYDIELEHAHTLMGSKDESSQQSYQIISYTDEITSQLIKNRTYSVLEGDYFTVKIKQKEDNKNLQFFSIFSMRFMKACPYFSYGGQVV